MRLSFKKNAQPQTETNVSEVEQEQEIPGLSKLYFPDDAAEEAFQTVQPAHPVRSAQPPAQPVQPHSRDILDILLETKKLSPEQHGQIRSQYSNAGAAASSGIEAYLLKTGIVGPDDILRAKAALFNLELKRISPDIVQKEAFEKLNIDFIRSNNIFPVSIENNALVVATTKPGNIFVIEQVKKTVGMELKVFVCTPEDFDAVCSSMTETKPDYNVDDIISDMADVEVLREEKGEFEDLEKMAGQSPVIKFVNYLISSAIHDSASDIHIEPKEKFTRIRYRIDGVLFETMQSPLQMHPAVVSRIKIMSNLDISERRLPQDGKISAIVGGKSVDLRVSVLPTSNGEKVVIRILENKWIMKGLEQLGMETDTLELFKQQIYMPHGILLVTGPTGSGKSTTLYSALAQMDGDRLNISTVEDPVEYKLDFCNQVPINDKIGMSFSSALRSLLRQDPDIVMIGEIRDAETARIAVQAALTGHLVLSTLHTNDAPSSITRLVDIGIEPYLIAASLNGIIAQRLVRMICYNCKQPHKAPEQFSRYLKSEDIKSEQLFYGAGCDKCRGSGYIGRLGIYEMLPVNSKFRETITKDSSVNTMRKVFRDSGGLTLYDDGIRKVKKGLTTLEEVLRVTDVYGKNDEEELVENLS
jgi:type IV pilus assembly protein PilB